MALTRVSFALSTSNDSVSSNKSPVDARCEKVIKQNATITSLLVDNMTLIMAVVTSEENKID